MRCPTMARTRRVPPSRRPRVPARPFQARPPPRRAMWPRPRRLRRQRRSREMQALPVPPLASKPLRSPVRATSRVQPPAGRRNRTRAVHGSTARFPTVHRRRRCPGRSTTPRRQRPVRPCRDADDGHPGDRGADGHCRLPRRPGSARRPAHSPARRRSFRGQQPGCRRRPEMRERPLAWRLQGAVRGRPQRRRAARPRLWQPHQRRPLPSPRSRPRAWADAAVGASSASGDAPADARARAPCAARRRAAPCAARATRRPPLGARWSSARRPDGGCRPGGCRDGRVAGRCGRDLRVLRRATGRHGVRPGVRRPATAPGAAARRQVPAVRTAP